MAGFRESGSPDLTWPASLADALAGALIAYSLPGKVRFVNFFDTEILVREC